MSGAWRPRRRLRSIFHLLLVATHIFRRGLGQVLYERGYFVAEDAAQPADLAEPCEFLSAAGQRRGRLQQFRMAAGSPGSVPFGFYWMQVRLAVVKLLANH
jgi:hypothetical protein